MVSTHSLPNPTMVTPWRMCVAHRIVKMTIVEKQQQEIVEMSI